MMINIDNADLWYETYMELEHKKRNEYIIETIKQPLSMDFVQEIDFMSFLIELFGDFIEKKDYEKMFEVYKDIIKINKQFLKFYLYMLNTN